MQPDKEFHITHLQLREYMNEIFAEIRQFDENIKCGYLPLDGDFKITGQTFKDVSHPVGAIGFRPISVYIRNADVLLNSREEYAQDYEAYKMMHATYHERRHVERFYNDFTKVNAPQSIKNMAKVQLISDYIPEYYKNGYVDNPAELDAEYNAFLHMKIFFETHDVDIDFNSCAVKYTNESRMLRTHVNSVREIDDVYQNALKTAYEKRRFRDDILHVDNKSNALQKLLADKDVALQIFNADTGVQETEYLTEYIAKTAPDYFRWYSCIYDDYCPQPTIKGKAEHLTRKMLRIVPEEWNEMARQIDENINPDGPQR